MHSSDLDPARGVMFGAGLATMMWLLPWLAVAVWWL